MVGRLNPVKSPASKLDPHATPLQGIPGFTGVVTGPARLVLRTDDHEQAKLGKVFVAPFADPLWTPDSLDRFQFEFSGPEIVRGGWQAC